MYAKLVFSDYNNGSAVVRDVVKLITDSAAGNASLSNLEFVNENASELITGLNSGWTLRAGQTFPSAGDALTSADSEWVLEANCVDTTKKKTIKVCINAGNNEYNHAEANIILAPLADPGGTYEFDAWRYNATSVAAMRLAGIGNMGTAIVHVFATPRKLIILGYNDYENVNRMCGIFEFPETGMTEYYDKVPAFNIWQGDDGFLNSVDEVWYATTSGAVGYHSDTRVGGFFNSLVTSAGTDIKALVFYPLDDFSVGGVGVWVSNNSNYGTKSATTSVEYNQYRYGGEEPNGYSSAFVDYNGYGDTRMGIRIGSELNSSNQEVLPLYPIKMDLIAPGVGTIDLSDLTGWYNMPNFGNTGEKITIGSDDYLLFTSSDRFEMGGSQAIKIE